MPTWAGGYCSPDAYPGDSDDPRRLVAEVVGQSDLLHAEMRMAVRGVTIPALGVQLPPGLQRLEGA